GRGRRPAAAGWRRRRRRFGAALGVGPFRRRRRRRRPFLGFGFAAAMPTLRPPKRPDSAFWISVRTRSRIIVTMLFWRGIRDLLGENGSAYPGVRVEGKAVCSSK